MITFRPSGVMSVTVIPLSPLTVTRPGKESSAAVAWSRCLTAFRGVGCGFGTGAWSLAGYKLLRPIPLPFEASAADDVDRDFARPGARTEPRLVAGDEAESAIGAFAPKDPYRSGDEVLGEGYLDELLGKRE